MTAIYRSYIGLLAQELVSGIDIHRFGAKRGTLLSLKSWDPIRTSFNTNETWNRH